MEIGIGTEGAQIKCFFLSKETRIVKLRHRSLSTCQVFRKDVVTGDSI